MLSSFLAELGALIHGQGEEVKLVVSGEEAEMFLGYSTKQFIVDREVRDLVENKVRKLKRSP